jgi:hypothetical protein
MNRRIASAIFDNRAQAERAIRDLKAAGVRDSDISMLHQDSDKHRGIEHRDHDHDHDHSDNKGSGAAKGAPVDASSWVCAEQMDPNPRSIVKGP